MPRRPNPRRDRDRAPQPPEAPGGGDDEEEEEEEEEGEEEEEERRKRRMKKRRKGLVTLIGVNEYIDRSERGRRKRKAKTEVS